MHFVFKAVCPDCFGVYVYTDFRVEYMNVSMLENHTTGQKRNVHYRLDIKGLIPINGSTVKSPDKRV